MKRKTVLSWAIAVVLATLVCAIFAEAQVSPPPMPPAIGPMSGVRTLIIGPTDYLGNPRKIRGKIAIVAKLPQDVSPASVEIFVDSKSIGTSTMKPFKIEFDTTTLPDKEITIKASGKDAKGKEIWTCSTKAIVVNSMDSRRMPESIRPAGMPEVPGVPKPDRTSGQPPNEEHNGIANKVSTSETNNVSPVPLDMTYINDDYGFSIRYPSKWTYKDKTVSMKPKTPRCFWIAFGEYPLEKAQVVVNIRRSKLEPDTDVEKFVKYNPYVQKWKRETVLGSPAFSTTSKEPLRRQVIHRLIIIKDGYAWMLNCEDSSGKSADDSLRLFTSMVNTLKTSGPSKPELGPSSLYKQPVGNSPSENRSNFDSGNTLSSPPSVDGSSDSYAPSEPSGESTP
jgi:hypothetical protein